MKRRRSLYARPEIRLRTAMRRGAAYPAERPSSYKARRQAVLRRQLAHRRAVMVAKRPRRCLQQHRWVARARLLGLVAQEVWTPAVPSSACPHPSSVRCGRPVSPRVCPRCPRDSVHCPVRASERPGVLRPVSAVAVRCPRVPASAVSDRGEVVEGGGGAGSRMGGMAGVGVPPAVSTAGSSNRGSRLRRPRWARGGVGVDSAVVVGGVGRWLGRPRGRPGWAADA
jgi:hypothetical protein